MPGIVCSIASTLENRVTMVMLDPVGVNMAIITDKILARGWEPNGFTQHAGYRLYRYKSMES